jgi:hypothetical protein
METLVLFPRHSDAASSFHLSHVRSLLRNADFAFGGATDHVPFNTERTYGDRVRGHVTVVLPGGEAATARAFEALSVDEVPSSRIAHGVLNDATYWFRCAPAQGRHGELPRHRAYFEHAGAWLFFYTEGAALPFGAVVNFSEAVRVPETSPVGIAKLAA